MSPDPLGGKLTDPQTLNKYSYVRNNPITLTIQLACTPSTAQKALRKTRRNVIRLLIISRSNGSRI